MQYLSIINDYTKNKLIILTNNNNKKKFKNQLLACNFSFFNLFLDTYSSI